MCVSIGGLEQLGTGAWRGNGEKTSPVAKDAGEGGGYVSSTSPSDLISTSGNIQKIDTRFPSKANFFPDTHAKAWGIARPPTTAHARNSR